MIELMTVMTAIAPLLIFPISFDFRWASSSVVVVVVGFCHTSGSTTCSWNSERILPLESTFGEGCSSGNWDDVRWGFVFRKNLPCYFHSSPSRWRVQVLVSARGFSLFFSLAILLRWSFDRCRAQGMIKIKRASREGKGERERKSDGEEENVKSTHYLPLTSRFFATRASACGYYFLSHETFYCPLYSAIEGRMST